MAPVGLILILIIAEMSRQVYSVPPYFFLCSYHGNTEQPSLDSKEVTVHISIDGDPSYYIPEEKYKGKSMFPLVQIAILYSHICTFLAQYW